MRTLKVIANHKEREKEKRQTAYRCMQEHTKWTLSKSFAKPLLQVKISTGEIIIDRITNRYKAQY